METINKIMKEVQGICSNIEAREYQAFVKLLSEDRRYFFSGEGRSGLVAKAIAMRLMHGGKTVFVAGETITPAIESGDVLVALSGSGKTTNTVHIAKSAKNAGGEVFLITTSSDALESEWCDGGMLIPASTKYRLPGEPATIQPLGNQFDQAAHIILDAAIIDSLKSVSLQEVMKEKHANLE